MIAVENESTHARAAEIIRLGGVLAFRTDTFYGLGADPFNREALGAIKSLKGREAGKPILVIISDASQAERFWAARDEVVESVCAQHWPGPLTIVARAAAGVPVELTAGTETIGLRVPDDEQVREFVRLCGGALTATSANLSGEPPLRTASEVARSFPQGLDLIVDGGAAQGGQPSTVLDLSNVEPRLIREGALAKEPLQKTLAAFGRGLA